MTLSDCFDRIEDPPRTITVYAPPPRPTLVERLERETGIDAVAYRRLPEVAGPNQGFLVVHEGDEFVAAIGLEAARQFLEPPICDPWDEHDDPAYRRVIETFDTTIWHALDRRQLLAISREIEALAWRTSSGTLRASFQRASALEAAAPVYVRLAGETALDVHIYIDDDWNRPSIPGVTIHDDVGGEIGSFWALAFDGGGDRLRASGLLAREVDAGTFRGCWTNDVQLVSRLERSLATAGE